MLSGSKIIHDLMRLLRVLLTDALQANSAMDNVRSQLPKCLTTRVF